MRATEPSLARAAQEAAEFAAQVGVPTLWAAGIVTIPRGESQGTPPDVPPVAAAAMSVGVIGTAMLMLMLRRRHGGTARVERLGHVAWPPDEESRGMNDESDEATGSRPRRLGGMRSAPESTSLLARIAEPDDEPGQADEASPRAPEDAPNPMALEAAEPPGKSIEFRCVE